MGETSRASASSSSTTKNKLNPFLLAPVVENMFRFVPDSDLTSCRLVCKLWLEETERAAAKRNHVRVASTEQVQAVLSRLDQYPSHQVNSLYVDEFDLDNPLLHELIRRLRTTISTFRADDCKIRTIDTLHAMIRGFPNLMKIQLGTMKTPDNASYHRLFPIPGSDGRNMVFPHIRHLDYLSYNPPAPPTLLSSVINTFPNLITLTVKNMPLEPPSKFDTLRLPALRKLFVQMVPGSGLENQHLESLLRLKLTLKELDLEVFSHTLDADLLKSFIESQSPTLHQLSMEQLNVEREPDECDVTICPFPLTAPGISVVTVGKMFVRNLVHLLNSFPKLQGIKFPFGEGDNWAGILPKKVPEYANVNYMTLHWIDRKSFGKLANAFTSLSSLVLHVCSDEILDVIFRELKNLKVLICFDGGDGEMTDLGLTGISPENMLKSITTGGLNPFLFKPWELEKFLADQRKQPYIGNLKKLEYLFLHFQNPPSEHIIWHGVLKLESLRSFMIFGMELPQKAIDALTQHNNLSLLPMCSERSVINPGVMDPEASWEIPKYHFRDISYETTLNPDL